tara:strand:- start:590 stop:988 length:399 start_codon:yes stop_codon:yes gene_type:complete
MDIEIINIAANTYNNKEIKKFTHKSKYKNTICGDQIEIRLIVRKKKIIDFGYQSKSCIYCQASASLLSNLSMNKSLTKINELINLVLSYFVEKNIVISKEWKKIEKIVNKKNVSRKECILLPFKSLRKAIQN